ncbi:hypothetical protein JKA74_19660 [Marivirga sp. S37H4]|uniref:DUF2157 domain-containing protein n=1 Tax=Marivirga aurantiaca TaxID=2802615 RepID=A0A935CDU2_9BACT|nr:hypothetical protein [Marivirga aurantiaca]MBK6267268.1 hypothetical protein [Marivirga aurantiaca]
MKVNRKEKEILQKALQHWESVNLLNTEKATELKNNLEQKPFNWQAVAYYSFIFAVVSLLIAILSIFADKALLDLIDSLISTSYVTKSFTFLVLSGLFFWLDWRYAKTTSKKKYSKEVFAFFGAVFLAIATGFLSFLFQMEERPGILIFLLSLVYFTIAFYRKKELLWFFGLMALMIGYGAVTYNLSKNNELFFGMNFPMRFAILGLIILGATYFLNKVKTLHAFKEPTYFSGLIVFFISLWILSISGNYSSYETWLEVKQYQLWFYSLILLMASVAAIGIGLKKEDIMLKNMGITFIFLNLYTRYFEFFWDIMHKAVFFGIIAISFWLVGKKAEKIWDKGS